MKSPAPMIATLAIAALALTACGSGEGAADEDGLTTTADDGAAREAPMDLAEPGDDGVAFEADAAEAAPMDADDAAPAEPTDIARPPDEPDGIETVVFDDHGVSGWVDTSQQRMSTFQTDADVASFRIAESWLTSGILPPAEGVRAEEWVNVLDHDYPAPEGGDVWGVSADAGAPWWQTGPDAPANTRLLRVGLRAADPGPRPPASITFVVDVSGSMSYDNRLAAVAEVISDFTTTLEPRDQVALVTFSDDASLLVEHTNDFTRVRDTLSSLRPQNSTNTGAGVILGYEQAAAAHRSGDNSSVVVLADGNANRGIVDPAAIVAQLDRIEARARIVTHTVGIGREVYNDALLEQLANVSGGTYAYIDGPQHTERLFHRDLPLLHPVAHDVKAQVEFDPATVRSWRLIGYENRLIAAQDFRDDAVTGSYVGAGHAVTALYELDLQVEGGGTDAPLGIVNVRWADPDSRQVSEIATPLDASLASADSTSATFASAAGMATLVEALRGSPHALVNLDQTADRLDAAGSQQDRWLATMVREAGYAYQSASPQRQQATTP